MDLDVIADVLTRELSAEQIAILNDLLDSAQTHDINGVPVVVIAGDSTEQVRGRLCLPGAQDFGHGEHPGPLRPGPHAGPHPHRGPADPGGGRGANLHLTSGAAAIPTPPRPRSRTEPWSRSRTTSSPCSTPTSIPQLLVTEASCPSRRDIGVDSATIAAGRGPHDPFRPQGRAGGGWDIRRMHRHPLPSSRTRPWPTGWGTCRWTST